MKSLSSRDYRILYIPIFFLFLLCFTDCAKKGTPSGGVRDTIPPKILKSFPENYTTNFTGNEIEIRFDEYIKLKDLQKELVVSPPLKHNPFITPLNTSKVLKIKINDTLAPNTTYVFNFGNSITDNNEGNVLPFYKYVFSTGNYIDSLKLKGRIRDARAVVPEFPVTVMLYEANENFRDSVVLKEKPTYVTITKDTTGVFEFSNLKEGSYKLVAVKEKNRNYIFNSKEDKIGFVEHPIDLPTDSVYTLSLFKEEAPYKIHRPVMVAKQHLIFGYEGKKDSIAIEMLNDKPEHFTSAVFKDQKKDTLHYFYKPIFEADTLVFAIAHKDKRDTLKLKIRDLYRDSLNITNLSTGALRVKDSLKFKVTVPISSIDADKVSVMRADSTFIKASITIDKTYNFAKIAFDKEEDSEYKIRLLPGAIVDFFDRENDTIRVNTRTRLSSDYGSLTLNLENVSRFPIIVELVNEKYDVIAQDYLEELRQIYFSELNPDKYFLRIIYDDNRNRKWDTGSFLEGKHPEQIIYYPRKLDVRANWSLNETFRLKT